MTVPPPRRLGGAWILASCAVVLAGFVFHLDGYALLDPDEGRNAEVAREMTVTNDWALPRLNGVPYLDKPPLFFVVGAVTMEAFGASPLAARVPPLLFTLATLVVVALFANHLYDRESAWIAAIAAAAMPLTLAYARTVIFDSALTLWVVLALAAFYRAIEATPSGPTDDGQRRRASTWWPALAWGAIGLGILTKGPVALALPLMVALPFAVWRGAVRAIVEPVALLLGVAIVLPWVFVVSREVPGFLHYALVTETARRLATPELGRTGPLWYFLAILPVAALPWTATAIGGLRGRIRTSDGAPDPRVVYLGLWILVPLLFFTLSQSKRPQYILPLLPAIGILVSAGWHRSAGRLPGVRPTALLLAAIGGLFLAIHSRIAAWIPAASTAVAAHIPQTAVGLGLVCGGAAVLAWIAASHRGAVLLALSLPVAAIPFASTGLMEAIGKDRSAQGLAAAIARSASEQTEVVGVEVFPPSLAFYLGRTITLATRDGSELTSNYVIRHVESLRLLPGTTLRQQDWWRAALSTCTRPRIFVVRVDAAPRTALAEQLPLIAETRKYAAYGPCGAERFASERHSDRTEHVLSSRLGTR